MLQICRSCAPVGGVLLAVAMLVLPPATRAQTPATAPSVMETPDDIVIEWRSPGLHLPPPERINETSPRSVTLLAEAIRRTDTPAERRAELVRDLGTTQLAEAVEPIRAALADPDSRVRGAAAQAAEKLGRSELAADVAKLIDDPDPTARAAATAAVGRLTADRSTASPIILKALNDAEDLVRSAALRHAATEDEADAIAAALSALRPDLQRQAIEALARIGASDHAPAIARLLAGDPGLQVAAIRALGRLKSTQHGPAVVELLASGHPAVRRAAVEALPALLGEDQARARAEAMLADPDPSVRAAAAANVGPVQSAAVAARLVELLADPYPPVHDAALETLKHAADDAVKNAIIAEAVKLLDAPSARRRQDGSALLAAHRSNAGLDKQIAILETAQPGEAVDAELMVETARAVGLIGDKRAADAVHNLAVRSVAALRQGGDVLALAASAEAIVAAARLGDARILEPARRIISASGETTPADPRAASAWAFGQVSAPGDRQALGILTRLCNSEFDSDDTKFEAVKAMGRLKLTGARSLLEKTAVEAGSPNLRWAAAWALARITGTPQTYTPPTMTWRADLAIEDFSR